MTSTWGWELTQNTPKSTESTPTDHCSWLEAWWLSPERFEYLGTNEQLENWQPPPAAAATSAATRVSTASSNFSLWRFFTSIFCKTSPLAPAYVTGTEYTGEDYSKHEDECWVSTQSLWLLWRFLKELIDQHGEAASDPPPWSWGSMAHVLDSLQGSPASVAKLTKIGDSKARKTKETQPTSAAAGKQHSHSELQVSKKPAVLCFSRAPRKAAAASAYAAAGAKKAKKALLHSVRDSMRWLGPGVTRDSKAANAQHKALRKVSREIAAGGGGPASTAETAGLEGTLQQTSGGHSQWLAPGAANDPNAGRTKWKISGELGLTVRTPADDAESAPESIAQCAAVQELAMQTRGPKHGKGSALWHAQRVSAELAAAAAKAQQLPAPALAPFSSFAPVSASNSTATAGSMPPSATVSPSTEACIGVGRLAAEPPTKRAKIDNKDPALDVADVPLSAFAARDLLTSSMVECVGSTVAAGASAAADLAAQRRSDLDDELGAFEPTRT